MIYNSKKISQMKETKLLTLIRTTKYSGYRLGDIIKSYNCGRESYDKL